MKGNISKTKGLGPQGSTGLQGEQGPVGPVGPRGPVPHIKFRYDASTGNLYCESDGIFTSDDYVGMYVEGMDTLDELLTQGEVNVGVLFTVKDRVATNGYRVTGKVSDLFRTGQLTDFGIEEEGKYLYAPKFTVPDECVSSSQIWLYSESGNLITTMDYPYTDGYPSWISFDGFGVESEDDMVSFYVAKLSQPMGLEPDKIEFEDVERSMYHDGKSWVEIATAKHLGDIDNALDAILELDEKLLGGDA